MKTVSNCSFVSTGNRSPAPFINKIITPPHNKTEVSHRCRRARNKWNSSWGWSWFVVHIQVSCVHMWIVGDFITTRKLTHHNILSIHFM